jgi:hypothetical protein
VLEQGRGTRAVEAAETAGSHFGGVAGEGSGARRVGDVEMALVPVATVRLQPCFLGSIVSERVRGTSEGEGTHGDGADEEAARGEVDMFGGGMELWREVSFLAESVAASTHKDSPVAGPCTSPATDWRCRAAGATRVAGRSLDVCGVVARERSAGGGTQRAAGGRGVLSAETWSRARQRNDARV